MQEKKKQKKSNNGQGTVTPVTDLTAAGTFKKKKLFISQVYSSVSWVTAMSDLYYISKFPLSGLNNEDLASALLSWETSCQLGETFVLHFLSACRVHTADTQQCKNCILHQLVIKWGWQRSGVGGYSDSIMCLAWCVVWRRGKKGNSAFVPFFTKRWCQHWFI